MARSLPGDRLNRGFHGTLATLDMLIFAESVNLITLEFRVFLRGGQADGFALRIDFASNHEAAVDGVSEQLPHHADHVVVRVIIIIPQYHVVPRLLLRFPIFLAGRSDYGFGNVSVSVLCHRVTCFPADNLLIDNFFRFCVNRQAEFFMKSLWPDMFPVQFDTFLNECRDSWYFSPQMTDPGGVFSRVVNSLAPLKRIQV